METVADRIATSGFQDRFATGVANPTMTVFRPHRPNGAACLIVPGGGYVRVVIDKEGFEIARHLSGLGITCFVLKYRLPGEGWSQPADVPLQDGQRAVRLIRAGAVEFGIDPNRVAVIGCSAGGHLASRLATSHVHTVYQPVEAADRLSARPDLVGLLYPVIDMYQPNAHPGSRRALLGPAPDREQEIAQSPHLHVSGDTPATFLVHAADDPSVPLENSLLYAAALRAAKVACEIHIFEEGGHGFGIYLARGKPASAWPGLFTSWASRHGWLAKTTSSPPLSPKPASPPAPGL